MVEVRLHGALAAQFGRVWNLDIASPAEIVPAIDAGRPGFRKAILDLDAKGMVFRVRTKTHDYDNDDIQMRLGRMRRVDVIPIVRGASKGVRFVVGAVLTVAGFIVSAIPGFQAVGYAMISAGASMMIGAVAEWLTPRTIREDMKNAQSWTTSGPVNTADQGVPVPIILGEVLTGSHPISAGLSASQVNPSGALDAAVAIAGVVEKSQQVPFLDSPMTNVFLFSASPFNVNEPFAFQWSHAGFAGVTTRFTGVTQNTVRLEVDHSVSSANPKSTGTGTVTLSLTGKDQEGNAVVVESTVNVSSTLTYEPIGADGGGD